MTDAQTRPDKDRQSLSRAVFSDIQFWVPFAVLLVGIALLRIVQ